MAKIVKMIGLISILTAVIGLTSPISALECEWDTGVYTYICIDDADDDDTPSEEVFPVDNSNFVVPDLGDESIFGHRYYARQADMANVYAEPSRDAAIVRNVGDGYLFATVHSWFKNEADETWYEINPGEYMHESDISMVEPAAYQGVEVLAQPERPFGWIVTDVIPSDAPDAETLTEEEGGEVLPRLSFIQVYDAVLGEEDWIWYNIGNGRWVKQTHVSLVDVEPRPAEIGKNEYWAEIDLYEQTFAAYEGNRMVYAALISSGLNRWPTAEGLFQVWDRWEKHKMSGAEGKVDYYFLEDIPYIMYFDKLNGIALHGTYWHNRFGFKHSHGCVNMSIQDSEWAFWWSEEAPNDLWVLVHTQDPMAHLAEFD